MGTSKSYGGPTDVNKLLPAWAQIDADSATPAEGATSNDTVDPPRPEAITPVPSDGAGTVTMPLNNPKKIESPWRAAKYNLSIAIHNKSGARDYSRSASSYLRARGGARNAARAAVTGTASTARLAGFLSALTTSGVVQAIRDIGLTSLSGKGADDVFSSIIDALAPPGATLEESVARRAITETFALLYEQRGAEVGGLERLESMTADDIRAVIADSVTTYVFYRWVQELGAAIERGAISPVEAVGIEREMRQYIHETVKLDLSPRDVLTIDWQGPDGRKIIEAIFAEAYSFLM